MIITHHREKMLNAIIYFAKNTNICGKTKLLKLLYFLDFRHFKQTGRSVTGLAYYTWPMGPVPKGLYTELTEEMPSDLKSAIHELPKEEEFKKIVPKKRFNGEYFSKRELRLLEEISFMFKETNAEDMIESTHLAKEPWDRTRREKGMNQKIDYMLSIDNIDDSLSAEEAKSRQESISEMHEIFGVA